MKILILVFMLSFFALAGLLYQESIFDAESSVAGNHTVDYDSVESDSSASSSPINTTDKPVRAYKATLARPLFTPTRRPLSDIQDKSEEPKRKIENAKNNEQVKLTAIIISSDTKEAMFADNRSLTMFRVKEGETFGEWTLTEIAEDKVIMSNGESSREFLLHNYPPAPKPRQSATKRPIGKPLPAARNSEPSQNRSAPVSLKKKTYSLPGKPAQF